MTDCTHPDRIDGKCTSCGDCLHEVILNGACFICGTTDIDPIKISPKPPALIPADRLKKK